MPDKIQKLNLQYPDVAGALYSDADRALYSIDKYFLPSEHDKYNYDAIVKRSEEPITEEQETLFKKTVDQLKKDVARENYVDLEGRTIVAVKADWFVPGKKKNESTINPEVYPYFTQGMMTGTFISNLTYQIKFIFRFPKKTEDIATRTKEIRFAYKNKNGEPSGLALKAVLGEENEIKGWILTVIQNTTARTEETQVTVLAADMFTAENQPELISVSLDKKGIIHSELDEAIDNDKIAQLIKPIFNDDGSLNPDEIDDLSQRIVPNHNIDDRDRKQAQLDVLFALVQDAKDNKLLDVINNLKQSRDKDINFFKDDLFRTHLDGLLEQLAITFLPDNSSVSIKVLMKNMIKDISHHIADLRAMEIENFLDQEEAETYKNNADYLLSKTRENIPNQLVKLLQNDSNAVLKIYQSLYEEYDQLQTLSKEALNKRTQIATYEAKTYQKVAEKIRAAAVALITSVIDDPEFNNPGTFKIDSNKINQIKEEIKTYYSNEEKNYTKNLPIKLKQSFIRRNLSVISMGIMAGILLGTGVVFALTGMLAPIGSALAGISTAILTGGAITQIRIRVNEEQYDRDVLNYKTELERSIKQDLKSNANGFQERIDNKRVMKNQISSHAQMRDSLSQGGDDKPDGDDIIPYSADSRYDGEDVAGSQALFDAKNTAGSSSHSDGIFHEFKP